MRFTRPAITAGAIAIATGTALTFAMPAFADPPDAPSGAVRPVLEPVVDPADAKVGDALPQDEIDAQLQALEGTQPQAEIDRIVNSNVPAATLTDSETGKFTAAVVLPIDLRALTPVGPGCSGNSACVKNTSGTPYAYEGYGSRTGRWANIKYGYAYGWNATFQWTAGTITVRSGLVNTWGSPVTVTKITR